MNELPSDIRYKKLKKYYKLLLKPQEDLERHKLKSYKLYKTYTTVYDIVTDMLDINKELENIHMASHKMRKALKELQFDNFVNCLKIVKQLKSKNKAYEGLSRVCTTFENLLPYIKNTFDYPHLTNGPVEGMNNKIKVLKRNAFGYRNFTNF